MINAIKRAISAILRQIARGGKMVWNAANRGFEWIEDRAQNIWDAAVDVFDTVPHAVGQVFTEVVSAPGKLLSKITGGGGPAVQDPGTAAAPSQQRQAAKEKTEQAAVTLDSALAIRTAARAIIRGEEPSGIPSPQAYWLKSMTLGELADLAALKPEEIAAVLSGRDVRNVAAYEEDAWIRSSMVNNLRNDLARQRFTMGHDAPAFAPEPREPTRPRKVVPIDEVAQRERIKGFNEHVASMGFRPVRKAAPERKVS